MHETLLSLKPDSKVVHLGTGMLGTSGLQYKNIVYQMIGFHRKNVFTVGV